MGVKTNNMETTKVRASAILPSPFNSTNGTLQVIEAVVIALLLLLGMSETVAIELVAAVVGAIGVVREWLKEGVDFKWNWNVLTYLAAGLIIIVPSLADAWELLPALGEAIRLKDFSAIISIVVLLFNIFTKSRQREGQ